MFGNLSEFSLPELLQMFERSSKTGRLSVWSPSGVHRIWFYQGRVIATLAPDDRYHLKSMLLSMGNLSPECISCIKALKDPREPIGKSLKKRELIDNSILALAFRQQIKVGVYKLFQLQSGQFRFATNAPMPYEEMTGLSKGGREVAIAGLRYLETIFQDENTLPQPDCIFAPTSDELPLLKLSPLEWGLLEKASPQHKLHELAKIIQADLLEVRKACRRLVAVGLLEEIVATPVASTSSIPAPNKKPLSPPSVAVAQSSSASSTTTPQNREASPPPPASEVNPTLLSRLATLLKSVS
ncbi:DUF4388 domain-containing protein [Acaryochloris sp. IP29b_bin.148]|uniref:DUF4388 domain-containing protein n=1 Tax=Acaryochloris sp. IP29b_bin.148 TaxID=2969218 RepID=UPI00262314A5|nr:DUF4388 domain-containing protein [Acaryochloris sp. IP29b_bin.148]